jgi:putative tryptophan/tyrosine transport system substrate-binding protein
VSVLSGVLESKRLEILREVVPSASTVAVLVNPTNPNAAPSIEDLNKAAGSLGRKLLILNARTQDEVATAFATLASQGSGALLVLPIHFLIRTVTGS